MNDKKMEDHPSWWPFSRKRRRREPRFPWDLTLFCVFLLGIVILCGYSGSNEQPLRSLAVALFIAGAATALGVFVGFLFGIPRSLQRQSLSPDGSAPKSWTLDAYSVNTNLEQISDWLTKIIVGIGLVEFKSIWPFATRIVQYLGRGFETSNSPTALVACIVVYFGIFGFLTGYLWTRVYLTSVFSRAEQEVRQKPEYFEGLMHAYLYQPMPDGFIRAIDTGNEYLDRFGASSVRLWEYFACAFGQQYTFLKRARKPELKDMGAVRMHALEAVERAIQLDDGARDFLATLWDPDKTKEGENDLEVFNDDSDFAALLNRGTSSVG